MDPNEFVIPHEEFAERRRRFGAMLRERDLDGALIWSKGGAALDLFGPVFYLSNHYTPFPQLADEPPSWAGRAHAGLVVTADGDATLISDIPDYRPDLVAVDDVRVSLDVPGAAADRAARRGLGSGQVGLIARDTMLVGSYQRLTERLPDVEWVGCEDLFAKLRMVKSANEIKVIRKACEIGSRACVAMMEGVQPGRTEAEIMADAVPLSSSARAAWVYDHPVASGPHTRYYAYGRLPSWGSLPATGAGGHLPRRHVRRLRGYYYDFGRSAVAGRKATDAQKEVLEGAMAAVEASIAAIRPGVTAGEVAQAGFDWLREHDFLIAGSKEELDAAGEAALNMTFPSMGHGLGMWWEDPWLVPGDQTVLEPDMVIAVERAVGRPGVGSASYEDDVLVTEDVREVLTPVEKRWWVYYFYGSWC